VIRVHTCRDHHHMAIDDALVDRLLKGRLVGREMDWVIPWNRGVEKVDALAVHRPYLIKDPLCEPVIVPRVSPRMTDKDVHLPRPSTCRPDVFSWCAPLPKLGGLAALLVS